MNALFNNPVWKVFEFIAMGFGFLLCVLIGPIGWAFLLICAVYEAIDSNRKRRREDEERRHQEVMRALTGGKL